MEYCIETVIHTLGFADGEGLYPDITYRFEPVDKGTVNGVPFVDAFSIHRATWPGDIKVDVKRDKAKGTLDRLYSVGLICYNFSESETKELFDKGKFTNKDGYEWSLEKLIKSRTEFENSKFEENIENRASSGFIWGTRFIIVQAFDEQKNSIGYCIYRVVKKI